MGAEERTKSLADGVSSVIEDEMQSLERRQKQQHQSMEQMQAGLQAMRQLVTKLNQTCVEISDLSAAKNNDGTIAPRFGRSGTLAITDSGGVPDASKSSDFNRNLAKQH